MSYQIPPPVYFGRNTFCITFLTKILLSSNKKLSRTLINVGNLNVYHLHSVVPEVRAQFSEISGYSFRLEGGGILHSPQSAVIKINPYDSEELFD